MYYIQNNSSCNVHGPIKISIELRGSIQTSQRCLKLRRTISILYNLPIIVTARVANRTVSVVVHLCRSRKRSLCSLAIVKIAQQQQPASSSIAVCRRGYNSYHVVLDIPSPNPALRQCSGISRQRWTIPGRECYSLIDLTHPSRWQDLSWMNKRVSLCASEEYSSFEK